MFSANMLDVHPRLDKPLEAQDIRRPDQKHLFKLQNIPNLYQSEGSLDDKICQANCKSTTAIDSNFETSATLVNTVLNFNNIVDYKIANQQQR
jgi:hypothetical protein